MKIIKPIITVIVTLFMALYMIVGAVLFAVDLSFDEKNVQKVLVSIDALSSLVQSVELSLSADELIEKAPDADPAEIYRSPEAAALFADIFTGTARSILYNEEYTEVSEELVRDFLCAAVNYNRPRAAAEDELNDYLSVKLDSYTQRFNDSISSLTAKFSSDADTLGTIRFIFNDLKFICIAGSVLHMLILILLIRGKQGYFCNAAVFGFSGISMLILSGNLTPLVEKSVPSGYSEIVSLVFRERFALVGTLQFAFFSLLMAAALILHIRSESLKND